MQCKPYTTIQLCIIKNYGRCRQDKHGQVESACQHTSQQRPSPCVCLATWHLAHTAGQRQSQAAGSGIRDQGSGIRDEGMCAACVACGNDSRRLEQDASQPVLYKLEREASQLFVEHHVCRESFQHTTHMPHTCSRRSPSNILIYEGK